jgi:PAS domain S-box-containing protein
VDLPGLYRGVVEGSPDGIWVIDLHGATAYTNPAMAAMYGVEPDRMDAVSMYDTLDDLGKVQLAEHLRQVRENGLQPGDVEVQMIRADGTPMWCLVRESLLEIEDGRPGLCLSFSDYTSRREMVEALRTSRRNLAEAQRIARVGSWEWDLTTDTITGSVEVDAMFGSSSAQEPWSYERFLGQVHPDDRATVESRVEAAIADQGTFDVIVRVQAREQWMWTRGRGVVHVDRDGRLLMSGTLQDVNEVQETRFALEDQVAQNTLMQAVASAANAASSLDELLLRARDLVLLHDTWERARGFWVEDRDLVPIVVPGDPPDPLRDAAELRLARKVLADRESTWDDARLTIGFPVELGGEVLAVITITSAPPLFRHAMIEQMVDHVAAQMALVAWREHTAAELEKARDAAMEASRMKSDFLATMSHEIRTPLNGVIGLNDLLMRTTLDPDQQRLATGVQVASRALLGVLNDILDFSKIEAGRLELEILDFEVREVVEQVAGVLGASARSRGLELVVSCAPEVPQMLAGDPTRLSQVLTNLVSNAIKFTEQGEVVVRATAEPGPDDRTYLRVTVSDTGIGVPADKVPGLFEPFTQADTSTTRVYGGTGLGLAICREIVQAMGGTIGYSDNPDGGAVFTFSVLLDPSAGEIDDSADAYARQVLSGRRMLVVDDNPHNRTILAEQLGWWGVRAVAVDSADEAVAAVVSAAERGHPFEAVLLDMAMPGHDGMWLARRLRAEEAGASLRLLMLTSMTQLTDEQVRDAGIDDLLVKPAPSGVLRSAVVDLVGGDALPVDEELVPDAGTAGRRILVVEDNPVNQMVAGGILEFLGYEHRIVDDGRAGVDAWAEGGWDAILMDVQMPVLDGYAATREIRDRETDHRVPVIAMTAAAIEGERERCLASGMDDYLTKPVDPAALAATLSHWVEGSEGTAAVDDTPEPEAPVTHEDSTADVLAGLDTERLEMLLELDPDSTAYLDRAIGNFMHNSVAGLEQMREAIEAGDAAALRQSSHRLAGGALNLGVTYAGEAVRRLEAISDEGTTDGAAELLDEVAEALERGRQALAAYQAGYQAEKQAQAGS